VVAATPDELTRPLGVDRPTPKRRVPIESIWIVAAVVSGAVVLAGIGYAALFGDPRGGVARVTVAIGTEADTKPARPIEGPIAAAPNARRDATEVEVASGVSVVRPAGTAAPSSILVQVPDEGAGRLRPAPDPRLVDRTRFGPLPRIGADGTRPIDLYARAPGQLASGARPVARVAIVLGGVGIGQTASADAIAKLPPPVTLALAPYGTDLDGLAARAREAGHEIMLQVPMEPFDYPDSDPGPHTLTAAASPSANIDHLHWAMGRFPGYIGVMNYMGGKLTADERALRPILREVGSRGLGFLDDGSSSRSVVTAAAGDTRAARADMVLDALPRADQVDRALEKLEATAMSSGFALGVASALPVSIDRIARWTKTLEARGILLVPASQAFKPRSRESAAR
jgi:polysaccharide deacetylase 2 family uncharacterized protein YibQ